ncbi:ATP-binding protein [Catenulispora yoronensis]|uniref:ATP-binding protein n=1 Tax=Catenulispora yoronensis TaxID=450799 RepID=A0ABP5F1U5_9ACTN
MAGRSVIDSFTEGFASMLFGKVETSRPPVRTSSSQAQAVYLPTAAPGLGDSGVIIGREVYSGKGYIYDPFQLYGQQLPAPHWLVLGESGNGKSALEKTYVLRQLRFKDRQVVVLDAQGEDGVGEWHLLAESLGVTPVRLDPHGVRDAGRIRLNPLDPAIASTGQLALLRTIVEVAQGRPLDERAGYALKSAHLRVGEAAARYARQPILSDVVEALRTPVTAAAEDMNVTIEEVQAWGLDVALVLDRLVDGDLAGMFDGPTTQGIDLDSPLIVFDLSAIDRNSIGMPILMAIVGVWLEHTWLRPDRVKRILLVEEAWHIINSPFVAQLFQRLLKFGRRLGLSFVAVVHHLSDVVDGAAAKEAAAILKMASTRTVYMQKADEARTTGKVLGLPRWAVEIIPSLTPGIAVWDVNGDVQVVKHIVTEHERPLVFTDRAMTETSAERAEATLAAAEAEEAVMLRERETPPMLPAPANPHRAIASGNQLQAGRHERPAVRPIDPDEDDELTAIAGMLFGKKAELPYRIAPIMPPREAEEDRQGRQGWQDQQDQQDQ